MIWEPGLRSGLFDQESCYNMVMDNAMSPEEQNFKTNLGAGSDAPSQGFSPAPVAPAFTLNAPSTPNTSKAKAPSKIYYIVFGGLAILVIILVVILCLVGNGDSNTDDVDGANVTANSAAASTAFENLTKAEALAFLQSREDDANGVLPEGYVGEEITDAVIMSGRNLIVSDLDLIYSYETEAELEQMARQKYSGFWSNDEDDAEADFEIKEYDYYAIVTPKRIKDGATSCDHGYYNDCDSLLSFKRSYLNYLREESSPHSFNDAFYVNNYDPEVVNELLRVYTFFASIGFGGGHGNIYSYSFEEQDDRFVLTVNYIGVGLNPEVLRNPEGYNDISEAYAINLFSRCYAADKADGRIYAVPVQTEPEVEYSDYVKSFPVTEEEVSSLLGYED